MIFQQSTCHDKILKVFITKQPHFEEGYSLTPMLKQLCKFLVMQDEGKVEGGGNYDKSGSQVPKACESFMQMFMLPHKNPEVCYLCRIYAESWINRRNKGAKLIRRDIGAIKFLGWELRCNDDWKINIFGVLRDGKGGICIMHIIYLYWYFVNTCAVNL